MANLTHMGVYTDQPIEMEAFYRRVLGLVVSDSGFGHRFPRKIIFLTGSHEHHHQFVLVVREERDPPGGALFQVSFKVEYLSEVRSIVDRALAAGASELRTINHGNAWSAYFRDPDGNHVEIYTDTGWYVPQPFGDLLDLSLSDEELRKQTDARVQEVEGTMPVAQWAERIRLEIASGPS